MAFQRWLAVVVVCGGFAAACSSVGELDGVGGSGGVPTGQWAAAGAGGAAGAIGAAGAAGGIGHAGGGGFRGSVPANELSCLKSLFAECPTDVGSCHYDFSGIGGNGGGGGAGGNTTTFCYDGGPVVTASTSIMQCPVDLFGFDTEWEVYKPDGSLCYAISRICDCGCETATITVRDGSGAVVGSGGVVVSAIGASDTFTCANGDACEGSSCVPIVRVAPGGCASDGICP